MKIGKRLSIALVIAIVAFVPAICDASFFSSIGGHSIGFSGPGTVYSGSNGDPVVSPGSNTISAALADPNVMDGDTLTLLRGTFKDNVDVTKSVDIVGSGSTFTIVDGSYGTGPVFTIEPNKLVTLSGMTIRNGVADNGAGIYNGGILTVNNCKLVNNQATYSGGAIYNNGILTVLGSTFTGNTAYGTGYFSQGGGAIFNADYNIATIKSSTFTGNTAYYGGAIFQSDAGLTLDHDIISNNHADEYGGGLFLYYPTSIASCTITSNYAGSDGGGIYSDDRQYITGSTISNNQAEGDGGGIYQESGYSMTLTNDIITGNKADNGAGIYNEGSTFLITSCKINQNKATYEGGGIYTDGGLTSLVSSQVNSNTAGSEGGGLYIESGTIGLQNSQVEYNKAGPIGGGGIYNLGGTYVLKNTPVKYNSPNQIVG
jgi:predicted outer membrane repeat protein